MRATRDVAPPPKAAWCRVAIDSPVLALDRPFDYRVPERMLGHVRVGSVVRVPLRGRRVRAFVTELPESPAVSDPAPVSALISPEPLVGPDEIALARWTALRYACSLGAVLRRAAPGRWSAPPRDASHTWTADEPAPPWLDRPDALDAAVSGRRRCVVVAPSPQLEAEAIARAAAVAVRAGGRALVLAPRVAPARDLAAALGDAVLIHADLRPSERARAWAAARDGAAAVVVGTRAALFVPLPGVSLVAVAAAHDRGLKEERAPRIHGLVVAMRRAQAAGASFVASSPAPPLELAGPGAGRVAWVQARRSMVWVRPEVVRPGRGPITPRLEDSIRSAVAAGRDALVFVGRRGFALRVRCRECGWFPRCAVCATTLILATSERSGRLHCRACGTGARAPSACDSCGGTRLDGAGWGTERVAAGVEALRLGAPVLRVDADTPLADPRPRPAVIVGTQSAPWALRGERLGAVCVADLDQLLGLPDFRAGEYAYQTLCELGALVAPDGRFLVQTREPEHHAVQAFTRRSYRYFAGRELPLRRAMGYPPFGAVVHVELDPEMVPALRTAARSGGADAVGPLPRRGGRVAVLLRTARLEPLLGPLRAFGAAHARVRIDVDPVDLL